MADVHAGWVKGLAALGNVVGEYNTNDRLSAYSQFHVPDFSAPPHPDGTPRYKVAMPPADAALAAMQGLSHMLYTFMPSVVLFVSGFFARAEMLQVIRAHGHKIVLLHTESPYQDDEQLLRAQFADLNIINDPTNLAEFQALAPSLYIPHAYDPDVHFPNTGAPCSMDFCFIGTMYASRQRFFEAMDFGDLRVTMGGAGFDADDMRDSPLMQYLGHDPRHCVDNAETTRAYRSSRASLNLYRREGEDVHKGEGWAMGPREVELAACGVPFLRDPRSESDELFPFLPSFTTPQDASEKLRWLLADEDRRVMLARQAQRAIAPRTFRASAARMLQELEES